HDCAASDHVGSRRWRISDTANTADTAVNAVASPTPRQRQGMSPQLPLHWPNPAHARFEDFDPEGNEAVVAAVQSLQAAAPGSAPLLLVGPEGAGKTHLAIATATAARA